MSGGCPPFRYHKLKRRGEGPALHCFFNIPDLLADGSFYEFKVFQKLLFRQFFLQGHFFAEFHPSYHGKFPFNITLEDDKTAPHRFLRLINFFENGAFFLPAFFLFLQRKKKSRWFQKSLYFQSTHNIFCFNDSIPHHISGRVNENTLPSPSLLFTSISPPCFSTIFFTT